MLARYQEYKAADTKEQNDHTLEILAKIALQKLKEEGSPAEMSAKNNTPPPEFVALFNGTDLSGWYGWGTQDPNDFRNMSHEAQLEYKKKSIHGGLLNKKGIDAGDHINAHWWVEDGELVNDGKGSLPDNR